MSLTETFTPEEQRYFDTRGEEAPKPADAGGDAGNEGAEAPSKTEQQATDEPKSGQPLPKPKFVPHEALHEERERRKQAEQQNERLSRRLDLILDRATANAASQNGTAETARGAQADAMPDPERDSAGALKWMQGKIKEIDELRRGAERDGVEARANHQTLTDAANLEAQFALETPDYADAAAFLRATRALEYESIGYAPVEIQSALDRESFTLAQVALHRGENPAALAYRLARTRGWRPKPPAAANKPAQQAAARPTTVERLAMTRAGQEAGQSLGAAPGTPPAGPMTAERVAKMSDDEFNSWYTKASPSQRRAVLGG
jgi:hypothetical protein